MDYRRYFPYRTDGVGDDGVRRLPGSKVGVIIPGTNEAHTQTEKPFSLRISWLIIGIAGLLLAGLTFTFIHSVEVQGYLQDLTNQEPLPTVPSRRFDDIVGYDQHKSTVEDLINGGTMFETLLLASGPSGTGKRSFAEATANRMQAAFLELNMEMGSLTGDDDTFEREFVRRFERQRRHDPEAPVVLFFDMGEVQLFPRTLEGIEGDDILSQATTRSDKNGDDNEKKDIRVRKAMAKMLVSLLKYDGRKKSIIISHVGGETQRVPHQVLIPIKNTSSGRRPWRQVSLKFRYPTTKEREQMVSKKLLQSAIDDESTMTRSQLLAQAVSEMTHGMNGAHISRIFAEPFAAKVGQGDEGPKPEQVEKVIEKLQLQEEVPKLLPWERVVVAFHEAGHVVSAWNSLEMEDVTEVTILPGGDGSLGCTKYASSGKLLLTNEMITTKMVVALAGQMAEKEFFGDLTTGAQDDLHKLTRIAYLKVANFGMDPGFRAAYASQAAFVRSYGDNVADDIDGRVSSILEAIADKSSQLIKDHAVTVKSVAMSLLSRDLLTTDDIHHLIGPRPQKGHKNWPHSVFPAAAKMKLLDLIGHDRRKALVETA